MVSPSEGAAARTVPAASNGTAEFAQTLGVSAETADRLQRAGFGTVEAVRAATPADLEKVGLTEEELGRIRGSTKASSSKGPPSEPRVDSDRIVEQWASRVRRTDRGRRHKVVVPPKESTAVLRRWVEGDDRAMEDWIRSSEPVTPPPAPPATAPTPVVEPAPPTPAPPEGGAAVAPILEREETVVRWLTGLLDRVKSDQFDPSAMIQEAQDLHRQLYDERSKRKALEDEIEHV